MTAENPAEAGGSRQHRPKLKEVRCLFLDLDGTIRYGFDELGHFVNSADDVVIFEGVAAMLGRYKALGYRLIAVTNQGGIESRQVEREKVLEALGRTRELLTVGGVPLLDKVFYCPHWLRNGRLHCFCRKPQIGMLVGAQSWLIRRHGEAVSFDHSLVVGDREEDRQLAENAHLPFMTAEAWREGAHIEGIAGGVGP